MAVTEVKEIWVGRRGSIDDSLVREYTRVFRVRTNSTFDEATLIMATNAFLVAIGLPVLPTLFTPYFSPNAETWDLGALCRKIDLAQLPEDPFTWDVTFSYSSKALNPEQRHFDPAANGKDPDSKDPLDDPSTQDPTQRPPVYKWHFNRYSKPVLVDNSGKPIVNSAKERFIPVPEKDDSRAVLTVSRNELILNPSVMMAYQDAVNADVFLGFAPGTCKVSIEAESQYEQGLYFWHITYLFEFRDLFFYQDPVTQKVISTSGWDLVLMDQGSYYLDGSGNQKRVVDSSGIVVSPVLLNGSGGKLTNIASNLPYWQVFQIYQRLPFAPLNIPQTIN